MYMLAIKPSVSGLRPSQRATSRVQSSRHTLLQVKALGVPNKEIPVAQAGSRRLPGKERALFRLISELCEHNAVVLKFESLAGRGAMIGLLVATFFELLVPTTGLFGAWQSTSNAQEFALLAAFLICMSAGLAAVSTRRRRSQRLLEAVIASLTSGQRSLGSLTKKNVDIAVDYVLDSVFSKEMLKKNFSLEE